MRAPGLVPSCSASAAGTGEDISKSMRPWGSRRAASASSGKTTPPSGLPLDDRWMFVIRSSPPALLTSAASSAIWSVGEPSVDSPSVTWMPSTRCGPAGRRFHPAIVPRAWWKAPRIAVRWFGRGSTQMGRGTMFPSPSSSSISPAGWSASSAIDTMSRPASSPWNIENACDW